jgi:glycosyltransferase 2 family protein
VLLGISLVSSAGHPAALAYVVLVRFVLFVPITLVGLGALVVRYGGRREMGALLRGPQPAPASASA